MSWIEKYKGQGPWPFQKQQEKPSHNEGDDIKTKEDPVWDLEVTAMPITTKHKPCGYWPLFPGQPMTLIPWHSCPEALTVVGDKIWFVTTLSFGYGKPTGDDALYIYEFDPVKKVWKQIYLEVGEEGMGTEWAEPQIALKSRGTYTVLALCSQWDSHVEIRVFHSDGELVRSYDPTYESALVGFYIGYHIKPDSLLLDSQNVWHLLVNDDNGATVKFYDLQSTDFGVTWTVVLIDTSAVYYWPQRMSIMEDTDGNLWAFASVYKPTTGALYTKIYKSTDNGANWSTIGTPSTIKDCGFCTSYFNSLILVVAGISQPSAAPKGMQILYSVDGAVWNSTTLIDETYTAHIGTFLIDGSGIYVFCSVSMGTTYYIKTYYSSNGTAWTYKGTITFVNAGSADSISVGKIGSVLYLTAYYLQTFDSTSNVWMLLMAKSYDNGVTWVTFETPFYDANRSPGGPLSSPDAPLSSAPSGVPIPSTPIPLPAAPTPTNAIKLQGWQRYIWLAPYETKQFFFYTNLTIPHIMCMLEAALTSHTYDTDIMVKYIGPVLDGRLQITASEFGIVRNMLPGAGVTGSVIYNGYKYWMNRSKDAYETIEFTHQGGFYYVLVRNFADRNMVNIGLSIQ